MSQPLHYKKLIAYKIFEEKKNIIIKLKIKIKGSSFLCLIPSSFESLGDVVGPAKEPVVLKMFVPSIRAL